MARITWSIFSRVSDVMSEPILILDTVCKWSQLMAHSRGIPSDLKRNTSEGMSRTVVVIGAMVTSSRYGITELRVRIRTGRFLSGKKALISTARPVRISPLPNQLR